MHPPEPSSSTPDSAARNDSLFLPLWVRHETHLRAFVRSCFPNPGEADDILQECALIAWRKFATLEDHNKFDRWVFGIARYQILMARRKHARERLVLSEDIIVQMADEAIEELSLRSRQLQALDSCIAKLPRTQRQIALLAYARRTAVRALAKQLNRSEAAVYQLLARIRRSLFDCLQETLESETRAS
jgi:RNA polymerase sigma-70 factor (ECF subfamily)